MHQFMERDTADYLRSRGHYQDGGEIEGQQYQKGGAAQADDANALTDEEKAALIAWYRGLVEDRAHRGKLHYQMPDVHSMPGGPGSYQVPKDVIAHLGNGSLHDGGFVLHSLFGREDAPDRPDIIHSDVVRLLGEGSLATGKRILDKWAAQVRNGARDYVIEQPDGNHGRVVRR
jgi:hypothetical protein